MNLKDMKILVVADSDELIASLTTRIITDLDADVTVLGTVEEAQIAAASDAFDIIVAEQELPDGSGLSILHGDGDEELFDAHVLLLADSVDAEQVLQSFRGGALDIFPAPYDYERLIEVIRSAVERQRMHKHLMARSKRLRNISSRLVRDRRELRRRVDLICRDLVQAYQRLATKFVGADHRRLVSDRADSRIDACDRIEPQD